MEISVPLGDFCEERSGPRMLALRVDRVSEDIARLEPQQFPPWPGNQPRRQHGFRLTSRLLVLTRSQKCDRQLAPSLMRHRVIRADRGVRQAEPQDLAQRGLGFLRPPRPDQLARLLDPEHQCTYTAVHGPGGSSPQGLQQAHRTTFRFACAAQIIPALGKSCSSSERGRRRVMRRQA
ncbi:hypothetical protein [Streptomyces sp. NPDC002550]